MVTIANIYDGSFTLPDGKTKVNMAALLPEIMITEVSKTTNKIRVKGIDSGTNPQEHFVLQGGITAFQADLVDFGVSFGFAPGVGDLLASTLNIDVSGTANVRISQLDMDFNIYDNVRKEVVAAGSSNADIVQGGLDFKVDVSVFNAGAAFVAAQPISDVIRKVMDNAISQIANDPKTNLYMDWSAQVTSVNVDDGTFMFNAGFRDDVVAKNLFQVYDSSNNLLGTAQVTQAQEEQSQAFFTTDGDGSAIKALKPGDQVRMYYFSLPPVR
jgi:hypothetical protein